MRAFQKIKKIKMINENIAAISTGMVASGVAVIRISGDSPLDIAEKMFFPTTKTKVKDFEPYKLYVGEIRADNFSDFGMCVYFGYLGRMIQTIGAEGDCLPRFLC